MSGCKRRDCRICAREPEAVRRVIPADVLHELANPLRRLGPVGSVQGSGEGDG